MKLIALLSVVVTLAATQAAELKAPRESVTSRFLRYIKIDTQSAEDQNVIPSTKKQLDLAKLLARELKQLGAVRPHVSKYGMVYASIPATQGMKSVPALGLIAHMDTSPEAPGANVKAIMHTNYQGGDIVLPGDPSQVIRVADTPELRGLIGDTIITSDGTTLLGSDDKAGVAAIMTLIDTLRENPSIRHGPLAIAFTVDEETGEGVAKFDLKEFGADFAYTVDGETLGEITDETWNAQSATITFKGRNAHPGKAIGIMANSLYGLSYFLSHLPTNSLPETTKDRVGFVHPYTGKMQVEESTLKMLIRDFDREGLATKGSVLKALATETEKRFPGLSVNAAIEDSYRNMVEILKDRPEIIAFAEEATRRAGLTPKREPIRGGTDGSNLTFRGLPCPNIFTGGHNFHSKLEFNSLRGLEKTTETLVELVKVVAEKKR